MMSGAWRERDPLVLARQAKRHSVMATCTRCSVRLSRFDPRLPSLCDRCYPSRVAQLVVSPLWSWVGGEEGTSTLILNTGHNELRPNQDCVDKPVVDSMVARLQAGGTFTAIELYSFTDGTWIADGHHRYVAAYLAGKKIKAVLTDVFSRPAHWRADWGGVGWC